MTSRTPPSARGLSEKRTHRWLQSTFPGAVSGRVANAYPLSVKPGPVEASEDSGGDTSMDVVSFENTDIFDLASGGVQDLTLTYLPIPESVHCELNGLKGRRGVDWEVEDNTVTCFAAWDVRTDDVVTVEYAYLEGMPAVPEDTAGVALFRWDGAASPSTGGGNQPWTVANGTYYGGTQRNGSGSGNGWQSDCHAHKTVTAQPVLACGYAIRNSGTSAGYSWTTDTDGDDFGIMSFCGDSGATCHINLTFNGSNEIEVRRGKGGTLIATSTSPLPNDIVGEWIYLIGQVKVDDSAGYVKVWMQREAESTPTLIVDFTGDTRNGGTSLDLDTIKIGGFYPTNVVIDDLYLATGSLGDPGDVTSLDIP